MDKDYPRILIVSPALVDEPLGAMYLSSALKQHGFVVRGSLSSQEDTERIFEEFVPDVVMFSVITGEQTHCLELCSRLKRRHPFLSVFGGFHPTLVPEILTHEAVDVIGIGEGDEAVVELAQAIKTHSSIREIRNFWIKEKGVVYRNEVRPLVANLDALPFPDRDLFQRVPADGEYCVFSSRGCPYDCSYCANRPLRTLYMSKGKFVRTRSAENLMAELVELKMHHNLKTINFHDDIFVLDRPRLRTFVSRYRAEIGMPFICSLRADLVNEEVATLLKQGGCAKIFMGVEAGNDKVRTELLGRRISKAQMILARKLLGAQGIAVFTQNILGFPGTTLDNDYETVEFNTQLKPDFAWVSIFTPYPGTRLGEQSLREGLIDSVESVFSTYHYRSPIRLPHRLQVDVLHKLFSLAVDFPHLLGAIKKVVQDETHTPEELQSVFGAYRHYKYEAVFSPSLPLPPEVTAFLKRLG
ncbi:MAG: radical SAM protein [Candidatus Paceibacterota bacterium]|jgi:radical SAM superfamily enzyme YgiQ (UPF0313 family)